MWNGSGMVWCQLVDYQVPAITYASEATVMWNGSCMVWCQLVEYQVPAMWHKRLALEAHAAQRLRVLAAQDLDELEAHGVAEHGLVGAVPLQAAQELLQDVALHDVLQRLVKRLFPLSHSVQGFIFHQRWKWCTIPSRQAVQKHDNRIESSVVATSIATCEKQTFWVRWKQPDTSYVHHTPIAIRGYWPQLHRIWRTSLRTVSAKVLMTVYCKATVFSVAHVAEHL